MRSARSSQTPKAADENLVGWHGILARILSVQLARPVGYRLDNVMGVLNAIRQTKGHRRSDHSLFFIAAKAYRPKLTADQQRWFDAWAGEVRDSIRPGEATYSATRPTTEHLAALFPEMSEGRDKPGGKRPAPDSGSRAGLTNGHGSGSRRPAGFLAEGPRADRANWLLVATRPGEWWLKGRDLERWRRAAQSSRP